MRRTPRRERWRGSSRLPTLVSARPAPARRSRRRAGPRARTCGFPPRGSLASLRAGASRVRARSRGRCRARRQGGKSTPGGPWMARPPKPNRSRRDRAERIGQERWLTRAARRSPGEPLCELHEHAPRAPGAADMARDPGENVGINVGDLRTLAQSRASSRRSVSRSTMGDRLIAASNAYKRAPADSSEPVLIDALPSIDRDLPDHSGRDDPPTLPRLKGSLRPHVLVAERAVPVRLVRGPRAAGADGSDVAKLRQRRKTGGVTRSCPLLPRPPHKLVPAPVGVRCGTIMNL